MKDIYERSLRFHEEHQGKIEVRSKVSIGDRDTLALAYTPGVAEVSRKIAENPKNAEKYTLKKRTVAIVTDGSAILGLGNLGALAAIPVMEGKAAIFKEFANLDAFPICLATQDTEEIIKTIKYLEPVFGAVNLEDISAPRCFEIERRLQAELSIPVMHDDQHGTATIVLAGLINALTVVTKQKETVNVVVQGAGAAGVAIVDLLLKYGFQNIVLCDSKGIIGKDRSDFADLNSEKKRIAEITNKNNKSGDITAALEDADIFVGVSGPNSLPASAIKGMNSKSIIFALANPTPEIMPEEAMAAGAYIVATGRSDFPNQINNALAYPGIFKGVLANNIKQFTPNLFIKAAEALAAVAANPTAERILPDIFDPAIVPSIVAALGKL